MAYRLSDDDQSLTLSLLRLGTAKRDLSMGTHSRILSFTYRAHFAVDSFEANRNRRQAIRNRLFAWRNSRIAVMGGSDMQGLEIPLTMRNAVE